MQFSHRSTWWIIALLAGLTLATFWPAMHYGFINYDDPDYITSNPNVQNGLTLDGVMWAFTTGHAGNWHPLTWLSIMFDVQLWGVSPQAFHLTNLAIHTLSVILLFIWLGSMTGAPWRSALLCAAFAVHPLRLESVIWAAERKDVLSLFFGMLTMLGYWRYVRHPSVLRYVVIIACFALCLLSKSTLVTLPCIMLLLDFWPLGRWRIGQSLPQSSAPIRSRSALMLVVEKLPLIAISAFATFMTMRMQSQGHAITEMADLPLGVRFANACVSYERYIVKFLWPSHLAVFYPYPPGWPAWQIISASLLLLGITLVCAWRARNQPWLIVGWLWFVGSLVPVIGLVQSGLQSMADRWSYFSNIGLLIMIVWSVPTMTHVRAASRVLCVAGIAILCCLVAATRTQMQHWQSSVALFQHAIDVTQDNWLAYAVLGDSCRMEGRFVEAAQAARTATEIKPDFFEGYCNWGNALVGQGLYAQAIDVYRSASKVKPEKPESYFNIGSVLLQLNRPAEAAAELRRGVSLKADYAEAHMTLARALMQLDEPAKALESYRNATAANPRLAEGHFRAGFILSSLGRDREAIEAYRRAFELSPDSSEYRNALAWALATSPGATVQDGQQAVSLMLPIVDTSALVDPNMLDTLAAAYARAGQMDAAVQTAQRAMSLADSQLQTQLAAEIASRLELFKRGEPYTQPTRLLKNGHP